MALSASRAQRGFRTVRARARFGRLDDRERSARDVMRGDVARELS